MPTDLTVDHLEVRVVLDPAGAPLAVTAITYFVDGTYSVKPVEPGPFDTAAEAFLTGFEGLDRYVRLW